MIRTKYLPPTDTKGGRIKATSATGKSVTLGYDHSIGLSKNHQAAATELARMLDLLGVWHYAGDAGGGYVFIRDSHCFMTVEASPNPVCEGRR